METEVGPNQYQTNIKAGIKHGRTRTQEGGLN